MKADLRTTQNINRGNSSLIWLFPPESKLPSLRLTSKLGQVESLLNNVFSSSLLGHASLFSSDRVRHASGYRFPFEILSLGRRCSTQNATLKKILCDAILACTLPRPPEEKELIENIIKEKKKRLEALIEFCKKQGYRKCATYLTNADPDMYTAFRKKLDGKTTSMVERVMRTVNFRINVGKWTEKGTLNVNKIRLLLRRL